MRDYLFRGKDIETGKWEYGSLIIKTTKTKIKYYIDGKDVKDETGNFFTAKEVIPETVGQFTGLTDINGLTNIFEGDITNDLSYNETGVVNYDYYEIGNGLCFKCWCSGRIAIIFNKNENTAYENEVIGNIHDNPELLEVKE